MRLYRRHNMAQALVRTESLNDTMRELIGRGLGIALLPHDGRIAPGTTEIALSPATYQREIALAWSPTAATPAGRRFLGFMREHF